MNPIDFEYFQKIVRRRLPAIRPSQVITLLMLINSLFVYNTLTGQVDHMDEKNENVFPIHPDTSGKEFKISLLENFPMVKLNPDLRFYLLPNSAEYIQPQLLPLRVNDPAGLFCKLEYNMEKKSKLAPRFRLGSLNYTQWMEGKGEFYKRYWR